MREALSTRTPILRQIRRGFFKYRRDHLGKSHIHSDHLRQLVSAALSQGHSSVVVGKAAGLSSNTILNWRAQASAADVRKSAPRKAVRRKTVSVPVELTVVKSRRIVPPPMEAAPATSLIRIILRGGAVMECPGNALTPELVAALQGVRP
jgi:hypothetical protein